MSILLKYENKVDNLKAIVEKMIVENGVKY